MSTTPTTPSLEKSPKFGVKPKDWLAKLIQPLVLLAPSGLWLLLLLVLPTLLILELSLIPNYRLGQAASDYGLGNYLTLFERNPTTGEFTYLNVIGRSIGFATGATIACLMLGFPVAYWIAVLSPKRLRNLMLVGFILPLWTSSLLRAYAWITILRPSGVLTTFIFNPLKPYINPVIIGINHVIDFFNSGLAAIHPALALPEIALLPWQLLNRSPAVFIGMTYSFLPYMVLILYASLEKLDKRLLEASSDLGATPQQTFWKVTVPQTLPGIAAGCLLVFIASVGDFVVPELLGGASNMTVSRLIYNQFLGATRNWGFGSALSMVMILAVSIAIALLIKYGDRDSSLS